jgi:CRISPR-associated protein Cas1
MNQGHWMLHVDRREAVVRAEAGVLTVRAPGRAAERFPVRELAALVLSGSPRIDGFTLRVLGEAGVATVFVGGRPSQPASWLAQGLGGSIRLRHAQHLAHADPVRRLTIARSMVAAKLAACAEVATSLGWVAEASAAEAAIERLPACADLAALQGLEGSSAARWFAALRRAIPAHWGFEGRERRPPPCPVNALLSFLYAVVASEAQMAVQALGMDPEMGFLHAMVPGRPALVLDAMEPLRPGCDAIVLGLVLEGELAPSAFRQAEGGCLMDKEARALLMSAFAAARGEWPGTDRPLGAVLRRHARALAQQIDADACRGEVADAGDA